MYVINNELIFQEFLPITNKNKTSIRQQQQINQKSFQSMPSINQYLYPLKNEQKKFTPLNKNAKLTQSVISLKKKEWNLTDMMPRFETEQLLTEESQPRSRVVKNQYHSMTENLISKREEIISIDGDQNHQGIQHRRKGMVDAEDLEQFQKRQYADTILDEPRTYKLHKVPSRCLKRPNYSDQYQKTLDKFENLRLQIFIRDVDCQMGKSPQVISTISQLISLKTIKTTKNIEKIIIQPLPITQPPQITSLYISSKKPTLKHAEEDVESYGRLVDQQAQSLFGFKAIRTLLQENFKLPQKRLLMDHMRRVRLSLLSLLHHLHKLKINPKELLTRKIFPSKPFEHPLAKQYLQCCKSNNLEGIEAVLNIHKYLVYEFDLLMMTALHWACKRGLFGVAEKILQKGADPDAQDIVGRTPLYLAIDNGFNELTKLLLMHQANPWNLESCKYEELFGHNPQAKLQVQNARKLSILLRMTPPQQRNAIWQSDQLEFYVNPKSH